MIDRLEKMKARATGNGITQCYLCSTDFGLLTSRSYAAMCSQCRRVSAFIAITFILNEKKI